jgi:chromosome segregation ATPase
MSWQNKLAEIGLTEQTASASIKKKIREIKTLQEGLQEAKEALQNADDEDVETLQNDYEELKEAFETAEVKLIRALEVFDKNKDVYAQLSKNLKPKTSKKAQESSAPAPEAAPAPEPAPAVNTVEEVKEPKKKSNTGLIIFGVVAAVLTLGAVNMFKEK